MIYMTKTVTAVTFVTIVTITYNIILLSLN